VRNGQFVIPLLLIVGDLLGAPPPPPGTEAAFKKNLLNVISRLPNAKTRVGACVIDLTTGQKVFVRSADEPFIPASTMKLFAMAAALAELGSQYSFETTLSVRGPDLILIGGGDPGLGDEKIHSSRNETIYSVFERWAEELSRRGIQQIKGEVVVDDLLYDDQRLHPSWERADLDNWYAAPVGGLNFNDNCLDITAAPATKRDAFAVISMHPANSLAKIVNDCRTGGETKPVLNHAFDSFEYSISGRVSKNWTFGPVSFPDPGLLTGDALRTVLTRKGIRVEGGVRRARVRGEDGSIPAALESIAAHGTPIADVLARAGKDSQNLFAECLLKSAGRAWAVQRGTTGAAGSFANGAHAVRDLMVRAGIEGLDVFQVADGSGLSRENKCAASHLASLLAYAIHQPWGQVFHDSLSVAGLDGSLRKRLKNSDERVHAKTGTMRGVRTLAGYVHSDSGPRYAFAILFNGYTGSSAPYKELQDRFVRVLAEAASQTGTQ